MKLRTYIDSDDENCEIIAIEILNDLAKNIIIISLNRPPGTDMKSSAIEILNDHAKNIIIISLYRPPGTDINLFIDTINKISSLIKTENNVVITGDYRYNIDYNIDILNADN